MKHSLALITGLSSLLLSGCYVESDTVYIAQSDGEDTPDETYDCTDGIPVDTVATIEADAMMETSPGIGSGVYVEYMSGGLWFVYSTCGEVDVYGECEWYIATSVPGCDFVGAEGFDLDSGDALDTDELGTIALFYTDYDYDGLYIQTRPGASLQLEVELDGTPADQYLFWVDDGEVYTGVPPIELVPDVP